MSDREIRFVGDLQRVTVKLGDVFVLKVPGPISYSTAQYLKQKLTEQLGGAKVLVLGDGIELGVMGADK